MPRELKWRAPEFEYIAKDVGWYWLTVIASILLILFALWQKNFLFAAFVVIAEVLVVTWGRRQPASVEFRLDERGLEINGQKFYPYEDFKGFAMKFGRRPDEFADLAFLKKHRLSPTLKVFVPPDQARLVKDFLGQRLSEFEYEESLTEHLGRLLRF